MEMRHYKEGVLAAFLLVSIVALIGWLYSQSNFDYESQRSRVTLVNELLQESTGLKVNMLLIGSNRADKLDGLEKTITRLGSLLAKQERVEPEMQALLLELKKLLNISVELKSNYINSQASLSSFMTSADALRLKLQESGAANALIGLEDLQQIIASYLALSSNARAPLIIDVISRRLERFVRVAQQTNQVPKADILLFSRYAMLQLSHTVRLKELSDALFDLQLTEFSRQAIDAYARDFTTAELNYFNVRRGVFVLLFGLLCLVFFLAKKQRESLLLLQDNTQALNFSLATAKQRQFFADVQKGEVTLGRLYPKTLGVGSGLNRLSLADWQSRIHPDDQQQTIKAFEISMREDGLFEQQYRFKSKSWGWLWISTTGRVTERDKQGKPLTMSGVSSNINEWKRNEQVLRIVAECHPAADASLTVFHEIVRALALEKGAKLTFIATLNEGAEAAETVAVWQDDDFSSNFLYSLLGTPCANVAASGACFYPHGIQQLFPDDELLVAMGLESYLGVPLINHNNKVIGLLAILGDKPMSEQVLTEPLMLSLATRAAMEIERQDADRRLWKLAHYDALTGLPNRSLLSDRFLQAKIRNQRSKSELAVCFLDLDDFKPINDVYGHDIGDELLKQVAARLLTSIRGEDTVSRVGGDEFVLLLGNLATKDECESSLRRIIECLSLPYKVSGEGLNIGASIGCCLLTATSNELDGLIKQADHAMYDAKAKGKNNYSLFSAGQRMAELQRVGDS